MRATRTFLEMRHRDALRPSPRPGGALRVDRFEACPPALYRNLYREVGRSWHWIDRLTWTDEDITGYLARPEVELWVLWVEGVPAGYVELVSHEDRSLELAYFGLLPDFIGRGLGGWLLTAAVERAWASGAARVWLHTSTLDHPAALANYLARGFSVVRTEDYEVSR